MRTRNRVPVGGRLFLDVPRVQRRRRDYQGAVLYDSSYGHIEAMASAVAEGAREAGEQAAIELE